MGTVTLNPFRLVSTSCSLSDMQGHQQSIRLETKHHIIEELLRKGVHADDNRYTVPLFLHPQCFSL